MREISFRGKRKDNGEWVEGYLFDDGMVDSNRRFVGEIIIEDCDEYPNVTGTYFYEIDPETVCQYTGLTDKNGRKIFEGDIVKINNDVKEAFEISDGAVVYRGGSFIVGGSNGNRTLNSLFAITDINYVLRGEVIGNIFDNPELIGNQP